MTQLADAESEANGWRRLEALRGGGHPVSWVCSHNPRQLEMPQRSHQPHTDAQRLFGHTAVVPFAERLRQRDRIGRFGQVLLNGGGA